LGLICFLFFFFFAAVVAFAVVGFFFKSDNHIFQSDNQNTTSADLPSIFPRIVDRFIINKEQ